MPDPLVPAKTPFNFDVGINYDPAPYGRTRNITTDLNAITKNFSLIRTYHDVGNPGGTNPVIDPDEQQVISYVANSKNYQLVIGTYTSAIALGGYGVDWTGAGNMTDPAYTDKWVSMIVQSFGGAAAVKAHLGMILLGNEIDQEYNRPPTIKFSTATYQGWFDKAFDNLKASLAKFNLSSIPVSTTIASYVRTDAGKTVADSSVAYIQSHWSSSWNGGKPVVLFNDYTPSDNNKLGSSTNFQPVIDYYNSLPGKLANKVTPYVGETGYSDTWGSQNQVTVYNKINAWLTNQYKTNNNRTIPLFYYDAFNQPSRANENPAEPNFGIYTNDAKGLKPGINLPTFSKNSILTGGLLGAGGAPDQLTGGDGSDTVTYQGDPGSVVVDLRAQAGYVDGALTDQFTSVENATGGSGSNVLIGDDGPNTLIGGLGVNVLYGLGGDDVLQAGLVVPGSVNQLWGGDGNDTASYADVTGTVYANLNVQAGLVDGVLTDEMNSIANLTGGSGVNTLVGDAGNNILIGGDDTDYLYGGAGNDVLIGGGAPAGTPNQLWGGPGSDTASYDGTLGKVYADLGAQAGYVDGVPVDQLNSIENLVGGWNDDILVGDSGPNILTGGQGADSLWGKGGADTFAYTSWDDSNLITGYDTIADFVTGTSKLDLSAFATDASHVVIASDGGSTSLYVEQTPGMFDAATDLAISFVGNNAIQMSDIKF